MTPPYLQVPEDVGRRVGAEDDCRGDGGVGGGAGEDALGLPRGDLAGPGVPHLVRADVREVCGVVGDEAVEVEVGGEPREEAREVLQVVEVRLVQLELLVEEVQGGEDVRQRGEQGRGRVRRNLC